MTLPVRACSDEELEGYAGVCPEAAVELARRIAAGESDRDAELDDLQAQLRAANESEAELESELNLLAERARDCSSDIRKLIDENVMPVGLTEKISKALEPMERLI
ncbi:hypothetical protein D3C76_619290 [compost metagenome]